MQTSIIVEEQYRQLRNCVEACACGLETMAEIADVIVEALRAGGKILTAGNGGSAADALHMAEELSGRYKGDRKALPGLALCADPTVLTCIANDYGYDAVFSRQIEALGQGGDIFVMFTTSGNSPNLLRANRAAREADLVTIAFLGKSGGALAGQASHSWVVPSDVTARIQEMHTWALHVVLETVEAHYT